jgi:hypothetical protein
MVQFSKKMTYYLFLAQDIFVSLTVTKQCIGKCARTRGTNLFAIKLFQFTFFGRIIPFMLQMLSLSWFPVTEKKVTQCHNGHFTFLPLAVGVTSTVMAVFNGAEIVSNVLLLKGIIDVSKTLES